MEEGFTVMRFIQIDTVAMQDTFTEWMRQYQENPDEFMSNQETMAQDPKDYGEATMPYFMKLYDEVLSR
jgi:hypothetical protein